MRRPGKIAIFLVSAIAILAIVYVVLSGLSTLDQLDAIESARDQWQHPDEIVAALDLHPGGTVVDLGSGAGYFSLKLAGRVGTGGQVYAVDLRRLSLTFLWIRARTRGHGTIRVVTGDPDDPHLPSGAADAVLICNTYHEFSKPELMLAHTFRSLRSGGRLVIADRSPRESGDAHEVAAALVESELRKAGFVIRGRQDHLLTDPDGDAWWLLIANKP